MAGAIPSEPGAADLLAQSRAAAVDSLKSQDPALAARLGGGAAAPGVAAGTPSPAPQEALAGPSEDSIAAAEEQSKPGFNKDAVESGEAPKPEHVDPQGYWSGLGENLVSYGLHAARGVNTALKNSADLVTGAISQGSPAVMGGSPYDALKEGLANAKDPKGRSELAQQTADLTFKTVERTFDPAISELTSSINKRDQGAPNAVGNVVEGLAPLAIPGAGPATLIAGSVMGDAESNLKNNVDLATAYKLAGVNLLANAAGFALPMGTTSLVKNLGWGLLNIPLTAGQEAASKAILQDAGYKALADKVDPLNPESLVSAGLLPTIIAILTHKNNMKALQDAGFNTNGLPGGKPPSGGPSPESVKAAEAPPPGPSAASVKAAEATPPPAAPPAAVVPDRPTAEPAKDLRAQFDDMKDESTPRKGVFLSRDNQNNLAMGSGKDVLSVRSRLNAAIKTGRVVDLPNGRLIVADKSMAADVRKRIAAGEDPQAVIGEYTGAGKGKTPDQTTVVQGQTPEGAVATESAVTPAEVPAKVEEVKAQGKEPVVTTPEAAVARRAEQVAAEQQPQQVAPVEETPAQPEPKGETALNPVSVEAMPKTEPAVAATPEQRAAAQEGIDKQQAEERRIAAEKKANEEASARVDQLIEENAKKAAPVDPDVAAAKKLGVSVEAYRAKRDADAAKAAKLAEAAAAESQAPSHLNGGEPTPEAASEKPAVEPKPPTSSTEEAKPAAGTPKTALESLPEAMAAHEKQEVPQPGRKNVPLAERQDNASAFAHVLEEAAKDTFGTVPPEVSARAAKAAAAAKGLALKSKNATNKGQGTGHVRLTAIVAELHKAARELLGKSKPGDEEVVTARQAETKSKVEKVKEKASTKPKTKRSAAAEQAEAEVRKQFPDVANLEEHVLAKRMLKKRTAEIEAEGKKAAATKEAEKVAAPVNEKYKSEIEPIKQGETMQGAAIRIKSKYVHADEADAPKVRADIEQWLHENFSNDYSKEDLDAVMAYMDGERRSANEAKKGTKMSDTVEEDESEFSEQEGYAQGMGKTYNPAIMLETAHERDNLISRLSNKLANIRKTNQEARLRNEWQRVGESVRQSGFADAMKKVQDAGVHMGSHEFLDRLIKHAEGSPIVKSILQKIRQHTPDAPIFMVSKTVNLHTGKEHAMAGGLFHEHNMTIQIRPEGLNHGASGIRTIVHEIVHAATTMELNNPNSPLTHALAKAYAVFVHRLKSRYDSGLGESVIDKHVEFFDNLEGGAKPEDLMRHLYGIANLKEFVSEFLTNPKFVREIADSETWASPSEPKLHLPADARPASLLQKIFTAIGKFFGISEPKLLSHFADLINGVLENEVAARKFRDYTNQDFVEKLKNRDLFHLGVDPEDIAASERGLLAMREEAPPLLNGTDEPMASMLWDEEASDEARDAVRKSIFSMKRRSPGAVRNVTPGLKTESQIYRDYMKDFGGEHDPQNPLRELAEVDVKSNVAMKRMMDHGVEAARAWDKLSTSEDTAVGALLRDATMDKIDPRSEMADQPLVAQTRRGFADRFAQFKARLAKLSPAAQKVFSDVIDSNARVLTEERKIGVDTALDIHDIQLTPQQTKLLYAARNAHEFDALIGEGMPIDVGENNAKLRKTLSEFADASVIEGPYAHLGRHGEHVVSAASEGTRSFDTEAQAKKFAAAVNELNPSSRSNIVERGGKWDVDYKKVQYTSMHETMADALADKARMEAAGFDMGHVTRKTLSKETTPLSAGMQELMAEAERKINRDGTDAGTEALVQSLRSAFLQIAAQRSAYAGSKLARKNVAGVKATEMKRNFTDHIASVAWHTAKMRTTFERARALARVRSMARDARGDASQHTLTRRGVAVHELGLRAMQDLDQYGKQGFGNATMAKLGFLSYLASPSHAIVWMTQNFTTGHWVAGARWGYGRSAGAHLAAMKLVTSPAFRGFIHGLRDRFTDRHIHEAIIEAVKQDKRFGKWAQGENSPMQQLIDRGIINHGYAQEMRKMAGGQGTMRKVLDFARLLPQVADQFNRISSALVGLELSGGDIRKAADFVDEVHARYDAKNQPRHFKMLKKAPLGNSAVMFKTYIQAMAHLVYGHLMNVVTGEKGSRGQSAKIAAGVMVGNMLFAGMYGAVMLEPIKLLIYGIKKALDDEGESTDIKAAMHHFLVNHLGETAGNMLADGPVPHALGFDMSNRMGLSDMFFHDPPDLLTTDMTVWSNFLSSQLGPIPELFAQGTHDFLTHWRRGEPFQAITSIIPVKQVKDAMKAFELYSTGKQTGSGRTVTKPSKYDALLQFLGLRPSSVALAADRSSELIEASQARSTARKNIIADLSRAYATGKGIGAAQARMNSFNRKFPDHAIRGGDIRSTLKFGMKNQAEEDKLGY